MTSKPIYHTHHIIPRHAGGSDDPSNLISLTIEEHAEAHRLLYEEFGRWQDYVAWKALSGQITMSEASYLAIIEGGKTSGLSHKVNKTGICGRSKEKMSEDGRKGAEASGAFKNSDIQKELGRRGNESIAKDRILNPEKWKEIHKSIGISCSKTVREKMESGTYENSGLFTKEFGIQKAKENNSIKTCPHCGKSGQYRAMKRWHFAKCKSIVA